MKKVMLIAVVMFAAIAANAASFKWAAANIYGADGNKYTGSVDIYAYIDGASVDTAGLLVTAPINNGTYAYTYDWDAAVVATKYWFYMVIEDGGKTFTSATKAASASEVGTSTVNFGNMLSATQDAANWVSSAVPEPTSGLLLLLGMAGLALKRKVA